MRVKLLSQGWQFRQNVEPQTYHRYHAEHLDWLPAVVPGAVHLDLARNGVIGDPFARAYEAGLVWVDEADWDYKVCFDWHPSSDLPKRVLSFEGLDTVCSIKLNGLTIGTHDNMFTSLEIDVSEALVEGENLLEVQFQSAMRTGDTRRKAYFASEGLPDDVVRFDERAFVRKASYMSGWDWGPRLISCGIWKPVRLLEYASRIRQASFLQEALPDGSFRVRVVAEVDGPSKVGAEFAGETRLPGQPLEFIVEKPRLWWPNGEGESYLYEGRVFLEDGHAIHKSIGLRTIRLVREKDNEGTSFEFEVNGRSVWVRGANWIPNDSFLGRETREATSASIRTCKRLGMNMLRVWGGGVYESEDFYDACDREGIMVWQDFPYACSYYPDGPEAQAIAAKEAEENVLRLRDRTSLALWCGNNENTTMFESPWGPPEQQPPRFYGQRIYELTLPEVLRKHDLERPYIPSSPMLHNDEPNSDSHYWAVWHGGDYANYLLSRARFCSEFGFASSCGMECWRETLSPEDRHPRSVVVRWHDKTGKSAETFETFVADHYPTWRTLEDWTYLSQLNQRDALRLGIEHYRRSTFCKGTLIWQFNDCWPVQSWAVQDFRRMLKPAGFELHRLYAAILLSIERTEDGVNVHLVNDGQEPFSGVVTLEAVSTIDGSGRGRRSVTTEVGPGDCRIVIAESFNSELAGRTAVRAFVEGRSDTETWSLLANPKETLFAPPTITVQAGTWLTLTIEGFAADLVAFDPEDGGNLFDLATGEPGWRATTIYNGSLHLGCKHPPMAIRVRTLAGVQEIELDPLASKKG